MIKRKLALCLFMLFSAASVRAGSPLSEWLFIQNQQLILKAVKEKCHPTATLSDEVFTTRVLAIDDNPVYIREAILARERHQRNYYQVAIDKIACPT